MATNVIERVPPQNIDAEMAVLGAMLIEKEAITKASEIISSNDFYKEIHKAIYQTALDLDANGQPVEIKSISEKLKKNSMFTEAGGAAYLGSLIDSVQTAASVEHYAEIVRDKSVLRQLVNAGSVIVDEAFNEKFPPIDILDRSQGVLFDISKARNSKGLEKASELIRPTLKILEKRNLDKKDIPGLRTGFSYLDTMTAGLQQSELIILAARPSMGKTALALNIAEFVALNEKKPVAIFSLEMSKESLLTRILASVARVNGQNLRKGRFQPADWSRITTAAQKISESPLYIDDTSAITVNELRAKARRLAARLESEGTPLALIMIDYMQIMGVDSNNRDSREREVAKISASLKALAKDLKIPVMALSQLSRKNTERGKTENRPQLSDLRDSGAIEQDADVVAFIHREEYYKKDDPDLTNKAELIIGKQRNGPTGSISLVFEKDFTKFVEQDLSQRVDTDA